MPSRTINGSPQRSAAAAWVEIERMVLETLQPAKALDVDVVRGALDALDGLGPMLISAGVLVDSPLALVAAPLHLTISIHMGAGALTGQERLGKVSGAATATEFALYVPDPKPYRSEIHEAAKAHDALHAGNAPQPIAATQQTAGFAVDAEALRRISGGAR
jgi:hypothetical protein